VWLEEEEERKEMIQEDRCSKNGGENKINRIQSVDGCGWKHGKMEREKEKPKD